MTMTASLNLPAQKANFANIARHLTDAITSGHFAVGSLLPTELELCKHYATSRHTVRVALSELERTGLVLRKKNVGTRVLTATPKVAFRPSLASVDDLVQFGAQNLRRLQAVKQVQASAALAKTLGCAQGAEWLQISSLRLVDDAGGPPVGWTDVYVDPAYSAIAELVREAPGTLVSTLIEQRYGRQITEIEQEVRACAIAQEDMAHALQVAVGSPALKIVRRYMDAMGEMFEATVTVHPEERFVLSMKLSR